MQISSANVTMWVDDTDVDILADDIMRKERLVTPSVRSRLVDSLIKLQKKATECKKFKRYAVLDTHLLPITNAAFDHQGTMCLTGSYDRTCKVWSVHDGVEAATLSGHTNVVFSVAFIPQHQNRVVTGSFDRTAKVWDWEITNGDSMMVSLEGHSAEVVALAMDSTSPNIATGSMDSMAKIFDLGTGVELSTLVGHTKPVIRVVFGDNMLVTASFDSTVRLWDMRKRPSCVSVLQGHSAEISGCVLSPDGLLLATSSLDGTAKIWDLRSTIFIATMDHTDEVLDIGFDSNGRRLVTCCSDCNIKIWDVKCGNFVLPSTVCLGHTDEVSKVSFSPDGTCVLSASADCTAKLWDSDNGRLLEDLAGVHSDEVFCCEFSVDGNTLLTASKDNTCQLWRKPSMGNDEELVGTVKNLTLV
ncbi:hypothetical protein AAG570_002314 [Ranatra chinensis]|uniref:Uncharacterized protein n=1 Tax=Ranatra chinensis TaxID=642074 RepID=A0ABD0Y7K6_9HEMI